MKVKALIHTPGHPYPCGADLASAPRALSVLTGKAVRGCIEQVRGDVTIELVALPRVIKGLLVGRPAVGDRGGA